METLDKKIILVTGVAGFIGSHIAEECLELGYKVRGIDNFSNGCKENLIELVKCENFEFYEGDITNYNVCLKITKNVFCIFHEAALGSVPRSIKEPLLYTSNNIVGMHNMLEASVVNNVQKFIYASSSSVYGDNKDHKKCIGQEGNILSPYALSKKIDEELAKLYYDLYGLKTVGLRYFNVFGERQKFDSIYSAVIPKFINAIINNEEVLINGTGNQSRDFTYVKNVVYANVELLKNENNLIFGKVYNIGCEKNISINELYNKICKYLNKKTRVKYLPKRAGDVDDSLADLTNSRDFLGYQPIFEFDNGLKQTIHWYLQLNDNRSKNEVNL